jgi:hypothetical protein
MMYHKVTEGLNGNILSTEDDFSTLFTEDVSMTDFAVIPAIDTSFSTPLMAVAVPSISTPRIRKEDVVAPKETSTK